MFGALTLPALVYLADQWLGVIDDAWVLAKRQIREVMRARDDTPTISGSRR